MFYRKIQLIRTDKILFIVQAVDYDQGENGSVSYFIISEDGNQISRDQLFIINNQSGELRMNMKNSKLNQSLGVHRVVVQVNHVLCMSFLLKKNVLNIGSLLSEYLLLYLLYYYQRKAAQLWFSRKRRKSLFSFKNSY